MVLTDILPFCKLLFLISSRYQAMYFNFASSFDQPLAHFKRKASTLLLLIYSIKFYLTSLIRSQGDYANLDPYRIVACLLHWLIQLYIGYMNE